MYRSVAHRCSYTETFLHRNHFTHKWFGAQTCVRKEVVAQSCFCAKVVTQNNCYTKLIFRKSCYTEQKIHRAALTYRSRCIVLFLQTENCAHRLLCTRKLLHRDALHIHVFICFYTKRSLHVQILHPDASTCRFFTHKPFTRRGFYVHRFFYTQIFLHRGFYTETLLHKQFYTQKFLQRETIAQLFLQKNASQTDVLHKDSFAQYFFTQGCLYRDALAHRSLDAQKFAHGKKNTNAQTCCCSKKLLRTNAYTRRNRSSFTEQFLHTNVFPQRNCYRAAFTNRSFT